MDRTHTPRGTKRAITLERTFDKDIWVYNKRSMDELASSTMKDVKRGKFYKKKIMRIKRQRSKSMNKSARSGSLSMSATRWKYNWSI